MGDGTRQRVGGHAVSVSQRLLVETAALASLEEWVELSKDGLKLNMYEQAISIYAVKDSLLMWGLL